MTIHRVLVAGVAAVVVMFPTRPLAAQEPPGARVQPQKAASSSRPAPKDAAEVLGAMRETLAAAQGWTCRSVWSGMLGTMGTESSIILRHDDKGRITGLRMTGNFTPGAPRFDAATSDGEKLRVVDLDEKIYEDAPWSMEEMLAAPSVPGAPMDVHVLRWAIPLEFYQPSDLVPGEKDALKLDGSTTADGVLCDIVDLERSLAVLRGADPAIGVGARQITRYVVGRDDHLPRRIVKKWPATGPGGMSANVPYELTHWKLLSPIDDRIFEVDVAGMKAGTFKIPIQGFRPGGGPPLGKGGPSVDLKVGDQPSDFALKDTTGKEHKLSAYKGKPVLVHFANLEIDAADDLLTKMKAKHGDKLVVLDLVVDRGGGGLDAVKKARKPLAFPRLVGGERVAEAWGINLFPLGVLIGPEGKVAARWSTGLGGKNASLGFDALVKRMGEYLKNPAKGW